MLGKKEHKTYIVITEPEGSRNDVWSIIRECLMSSDPKSRVHNFNRYILLYCGVFRAPYSICIELRGYNYCGSEAVACGVVYIHDPSMFVHTVSLYYLKLKKISTE